MPEWEDECEIDWCAASSGKVLLEVAREPLLLENGAQSAVVWVDAVLAWGYTGGQRESSGFVVYLPMRGPPLGSRTLGWRKAINPCFGG